MLQTNICISLCILQQIEINEFFNTAGSRDVA